MKALRIILRFLFVIANIIAVVLLIVSAYSDRFSPDTSVLFPYLGLAFPLLCLANLCFILYWLFLRAWWLSLVGVVAFLVCWGPVTRYFPLNSRQDVPKEDALKILTYNVMAFGYRDHTKTAPNPIIKYIAQSDADIVCLQEYAEAKSEKSATAKKILDAFKMYPYRSVFYFHKTHYSNFGIAVYSKYPITRSRRIKYDSEDNGSTVHEITVRGKTITLINNHLESFKLTMADRTLYKSVIKNMGADGLDELKGAFDQKLGPAFKIRAKQAEAVAREIKNAKSDYVLVCGDFNDTPISYAHRTIQGDLTDAFAESGRGMGITYHQNFFWFRIDNILHSPNARSMNCTVDSQVDDSDHYPLWCYLKLE